jgi:hypothetical protein
MYRVKGADEKEYGPITAEQVQQWIRENRLNRFSLAEKDGEPGWKPLEQFPEFASAWNVVAGNSDIGSGAGTRKDAVDKVKVPAIALIVWGWIFAAMGAWGMVGSLSGNSAAELEEAKSTISQLPASAQEFATKWIEIMLKFAAVLNGGTLLIGVTIAVGALKMLRLKSAPMSWAAAILATQPCLNPCCCFSTVFGIWAIVALCNANVKSHFE